MYKISSILGTTLCYKESIDDIVLAVKSQIPLSSKKESKMRNALANGINQYCIEYDNCAVYLEKQQ